jgi:ABC-type branched-subunit amino acid transport system substrate-binding protein
MTKNASLLQIARCACVATALLAGCAGAQEITMGQVGPFTVIPVPDAPEINAGIQAYIKSANAAGGLRGNKIGFFSLDDRYSGSGFQEQFGKALEHRPVALLSPIGSDALTALLKNQLLDKGDVVVMNAIPGAESIRTPGHPRMFHIRAGDKQQIEKIVHHARTLGTTKMAVLYQDLAIGTSGFAMATEAAKAEGGMELQGVKTTWDAKGLATGAEAVKKLDAQSVLVVGAPRFMGDGVAALRKAGVSQSLFVLSYVPAGMLVKLAGPEGARGVGIAQTYPNPNGIVLPIQREFQAAMRAAYPDLKSYSPFHLEGYLSARVVAEAIKRSKEKEMTPAALERALHAAGEMDFGGFRVDFSKGNVGSHWVDIGVVTAEGKIRY